MDQALIEKYLKVKALALRGSDGEKQNAKKILERMETENPGLAKAAALWERKQKLANGEDPEPAREKKAKKAKGNTPPPGVWPKEWEEAQEDLKNGNWENIFRYAQAAFSGVYGFAENVSAAYVGRELAYEVEPESKMSKMGSLNIMLKIPLAVYHKVGTLNGMQRTAFRQTLHELLDAQLDAVFGNEPS
jgi:hypothetical protein